MGDSWRAMRELTCWASESQRIGRENWWETGVMPGGGIMLSCGPSFCQPHPFDGGAFTLVHGGPGQAQR